MYDYSEVYQRANIQQLAYFLLYGEEAILDEKSPESRLKKAERTLLKQIRPYVAEKDLDDLLSIIYHYATITGEIHMEIGLRCGMQL